MGGRCAPAQVPRVRRLVHLPDGRRHGHRRDGRRARLPRRRAVRARPAAGAEDAPARAEDPRGRRAVAWGAKTIPEGGFVALPKRLHAPGLLICGDGAGLVNVPALKGIHYAIESGRLAAEAAFAAMQPARPRDGAARSTATTRRCRELRLEELQEVRNMRQAIGRGFWLGGALAGAMTATKGHFPPGNARTERDVEQDLIRSAARRAIRLPDGKLTFDKLSRSSPRGNKTRDDQPNHIRVRTECRREIAELGSTCARAGVRRPTRGGARDAVEMRPVRRDHRQGRPADAA